MSERACEGGRTLKDWDGDEFEECAECGTRVHCDFVAHRVFGFQNCSWLEERQRADDIREARQLMRLEGPDGSAL